MIYDSYVEEKIKPIFLMTQPTPKDSKQQILQAFNKLLLDYQKGDSKIATKEEEAEKAKNQWRHADVQ